MIFRFISVFYQKSSATELPYFLHPASLGKCPVINFSKVAYDNSFRERFYYSHVKNLHFVPFFQHTKFDLIYHLMKLMRLFQKQWGKYQNNSTYKVIIIEVKVGKEQILLNRKYLSNSETKQLKNIFLSPSTH